MNAISKALQEIHFNIPPEVLQITFMEYGSSTNQVISMDERILNAVIRPRVLLDTNLVGGVLVRVPIDQCYVREMLNREFLIEVPKHLTSGRSMVSVLSLISMTGYTSVMPNHSTSQLVAASNKMYDSIADANVVQTARLELVGENTVFCSEPSIFIYSAVLRCVIENEINMGNLHPRNYPVFSKLCVLAVQSYIYNHMKVKLDQGYVYGGHELSSVTDIIDSYSDREEMYQEHLNLVFRKVAHINDSESQHRLIKLAVGNLI